MGPTQTTRCQTCQAIVNPSWESCAACRSPLTSSEIVIEPAATNPRPVYWECGTGEILGPAVPEYLARDGETFWIVTTFEGQIRWINADRLRSRKAFEQQRKPHVIELVRDRK